MSIFLLLIVLGLVAEHYFPYWAEWTGHKLPSPVRLVVNYVAGSCVWFGAFGAWLIVNGYSRIAVIGFVFALVAGTTVILLYAIDAYVKNKRAMLDSREENALLERQKSDAKKRS